MKLQAHCYLTGKVRFNKYLQFNYDGYEVSIRNAKIPNSEKEDLEGLELNIQKDIDVETIKTTDKTHEQDSQKFQELVRAQVYEIATYIHGWLAVHYGKQLPRFDVLHLMVNYLAETEEEKASHKEGKTLQGHGDVHVINKPGVEFIIEDDTTKSLEEESSFSPLFRYFFYGLEANNNGDYEIAFTMLFRILEGLYGDGKTHLKGPFLKHQVDFEEILSKKTKSEICEDLQILITGLGLPYKTNADKTEELITNLIIYRHKMLHYELGNTTHMNPTITRPTIKRLNLNLLLVCQRAIYKVGNDSE